MKTPFVKMHGNGNDFVIIDNIKQNFKKDKTLIKKITNRKIGIGCDQLILIEKSAEYDAFMRIYNNDGSEAEMCGNAARCVASLLMAGTKKTEICIETNSTLLNASLEKNNEISVKMLIPEQNLKNIIKDNYKKIINLEEIDPLLKEGHVINMGNPHIVFFTKSLDLINLDKVGKSIETHEAFVKGVNIEIVEILTPSSLKLKFWERGAGKTLSCGSGILAASYASFINKKCSNSIKISLPIGSVKVNIKENELEIIGVAEVSYLGEYNFA
jgi:diaminopimelate epimerase